MSYSLLKIKKERKKKGEEGEIVRLTTIIPLKITEEEIDQKVDKLPKVTQ